MYEAATVSAWSVDAFQCLNRRLLTVLSVEEISRIEGFVESYVLYDRVVLPRRYADNTDLLSLDLNRDIFVFADRDLLAHSDDMTNHISFDLGLYERAFKEIVKEDRYWTIQHDPRHGEELLRDPQIADSKMISRLRLWQWGLMNEMSEVYSAVPIFPSSLSGIEKYDFGREQLSDSVVAKYADVARSFEKRLFKISQYVTDPFIRSLRNVPPLLMLYIDRAVDAEGFAETLTKMRSEFSEFRELRKKFATSLSDAKTLGEKNKIVDDWEASWGRMCSRAFKKPTLLSRKVSSADVSTAVVTVGMALPKTVLKNYLDYMDELKSYNVFRVFVDFTDKLEMINLGDNKLADVFGVQRIVGHGKI